MANLKNARTGTVKARQSDSNSMLSIPGVSTLVVGIVPRPGSQPGYGEWETELIVDSVNLLLAIGGKSVVDDKNLKFNIDFKKE